MKLGKVSSSVVAGKCATMCCGMSALGPLDGLTGGLQAKFLCVPVLCQNTFWRNNIVVQLLKCMWQDTYGAHGAHHGTHDLHGEEAVHPEPRTCHA